MIPDSVIKIPETSFFTSYKGKISLTPEIDYLESVEEGPGFLYEVFIQVKECGMLASPR